MAFLGLVLASALGLALVTVSCGMTDSRLATIWTDVPEIALYAELFNRGQDRYRVEVIWKAGLARELKDTKAPPDLVIGNYLRSALVRDRFRSLEYLFGELTVDQTAFYPGLLALGVESGQQLTLPLSFNLPTIFFLKEGEARPADARTIGLDELSRLALAYDRGQGSSYTRIGFSPRWDPNFLVLAVNVAGASFREGKPLDWSEPGLRLALDRLRSWGGPTAALPTVADDFQFKYLFTPPYTYVAEGRALFAYQSSSDFFLIPEGKSAALDFRWFSESRDIHLLEDIVFAGLPRSSRDQQAAEAFLGWLFKPSNQQAMLESSRRTRALESSFGIAGGFSSLREVTENVFPLYYAALKDRVPPAEEIGSPDPLPREWPTLKADVIGPWLRDVLAREAGTASAPPAKPPLKAAELGAELAGKITDYLRSGQGSR